MAERAATIQNRRGLHARAAAKLVTLAERFCSDVQVDFDGHVVAAASIMGLMMLGAAQGTTLVFRAHGSDAADALQALVELVEAGFDETD